MDPVARALTHLVVEPEHRSGLGPPRSARAGSSEGATAVELRYTLDEFDAPPAEENDFLPGGSGYADYAAHEAYYWPYYGIEPGGGPVGGQCKRPSSPTISCPRARSGVRRGEHVHATDGEIGKVEGLVVEPAHGHVTHVLLQEGHLWGRKQVAIPDGRGAAHRRRRHRELDQTRDREPSRGRPHRTELVATLSRHQHEPTPDTAGLEEPVRLGRLLERQRPHSDAQCEDPVLGLDPQPVELVPHAGVMRT